MAVQFVSIFQVREGQRDKFMDEAREANRILTRLGARYRLGEFAVAGPATGQFVVIQEFDDLAAYSSFMQRRASDGDWQKYQKNVHGKDSSTVLVSRSLVEDVAL